MRKPMLFLTVLGLLVALSACTAPADGQTNGTTQAPPSTTTTAPSTTQSAVTTTENTVSVTREKAIELALNAAGVARDAVYDLEAELDRESKGLYWEVDFETREYEYSYDIHAETGAVARAKRERND